MCGCVGEVELVALEHRLEGFLDERLDRLLADRVGELLPDDGGGGLAGAEAGEADLRGVSARGAVLGALHVVGGDGDGEAPLQPFGLGRCDVDRHGGKIIGGEPRCGGSERPRRRPRTPFRRAPGGADGGRQRVGVRLQRRRRPLSSSMAERRYDDDEVAAIFELASKSERAALPASSEGKGLTLAALQDIGREIGIAPESIALASRSLDQARHLSSPTMLGLPIGVGRVVEFDRPLSDPEWEELVADLRTTFQARGVIKYDGPFRQWTNGNLQALLEPAGKGHRLRLQTVQGAARARMTAGGIMVAGSAATFIATTLLGTAHNAGAALGIGFIALMGVGMFAAGALRVPGWARRRTEQFDAVIARLTEARSRREKDPP